MKRRPHISDKEIAALLRTPAEKRRIHLVGQVAGWGGMWCLRDGQRWLLLSGGAFPVWPHEPYAAAFAEGTGRTGFSPFAVSLERWFSDLAVTLGGRVVELFPTASDPGVAVPATGFNADLRDALAAYGEDYRKTD